MSRGFRTPFRIAKSEGKVNARGDPLVPPPPPPAAAAAAASAACASCPTGFRHNPERAITRCSKADMVGWEELAAPGKGSVAFVEHKKRKQLRLRKQNNQLWCRAVPGKTKAANHKKGQRGITKPANRRPRASLNKFPHQNKRKRTNPQARKTHKRADTVTQTGLIFACSQALFIIVNAPHTMHTHSHTHTHTYTHTHTCTCLFACAIFHCWWSLLFGWFRSLVCLVGSFWRGRNKRNNPTNQPTKPSRAVFFCFSFNDKTIETC